LGEATSLEKVNSCVDASGGNRPEEPAEQILGGLDAAAAAGGLRIHVHRAADVEDEGDDRGVAGGDLGWAAVGDLVVAVDEAADLVENGADAVGLRAVVGAAGECRELLERLLVGFLAVGNGEERDLRGGNGLEDLLLCGAAAVAGILDL
jgi:hypothetical protein